MVDGPEHASYVAMMNAMDRAILAAFAVPLMVFGRPPHEPGCTCFHCCVAAGLDPRRLELHEAGVIDMAEEITRAIDAEATGRARTDQSATP